MQPSRALVMVTKTHENVVSRPLLSDILITDGSLVAYTPFDGNKEEDGGDGGDSSSVIP